MGSNSKPVLGYWNIRGYVHHIRLLLAYLGVDYEDRVYDQGNAGEFNRETWFEKEKFHMGLDFPNLPYWVDGDVKMTESKAILRHLARVNDPTLMGKNNDEIRELETLECVAWDLCELLVRCVYDYTEARIQNYDEMLPQKLEQMSKYLGDKKWFTGDIIKYADFTIYEMLTQQKFYKPDVLKPYPNLVKYLENFEALPSIAKYIKSPNYINSPVYSIWAKYKI